jgi:hypothetical protein
MTEVQNAAPVGDGGVVKRIRPVIRQVVCKKRSERDKRIVKNPEKLFEVFGGNALQLDGC